MTRINMRYGICRQSFVACLILILASIGSSFASTFTATLKNGTGSTVTTAYLHFELWNCGTNFPTVSGQPQTIVQFTFDLKANAMTGVITGTVLGNDVILCGNVASTEWIITPMFGQNQPFGPSHKYVICDAGIPPGQSFCSNSGFGTAAFASLNPTDGVPPPSPGFNPVYSNPVASQTVTEPIGSQFAFAGTLNLCSATVLCGGSGGGSVTAATQYAMPYYANPGTDTAISGVSAPTAPNNVPELFTSTPSGGVAALGAFNLPGVGIRESTCASNLDTILATDRVGYVSWTDASPCTVTLPQANSSGFGSNFAFLGCNIGAGTVTLMPTVSTISYANGTSYTSGASSVALLTGQCINVKSNNTNYRAILSGTGLPVSPQIGDTLRFNVNGDGLWDAVNYAQPVIGLYAVSQLSTLQAFGAFGSTTISVTNNSSSTISPTAISQAGSSYGETGGNASLNTVIGANFGENGSTSTIGMQAFYRWSFKAALGGLTTSRYWFGLACHTGGGTGNNGAVIVGTTAYASDTPNKSTEGFLYSAGQAGGDFQAVAVTAGGSQTNVDTHVVADTSPHLFEMTTNSTGTSILYWIDGTNVATISTNLPPPANNANSWGDLFFTGDNKNSTAAISLIFYSMQISLK